MPWLVNDQIVSESLIREEQAKIAHHPGWLQIRDEAERDRRIHLSAVRAAQNKVLLAQTAAKDPRPIDPKLIAEHLPKFRGANGNQAFDEASARYAVELSLRVERLLQEMTAAAPEPAAEEIEAFYRQNRQNFLGPERFRASHIVKHHKPTRHDLETLALMFLPRRELQSGVPFAEVARRHSDCPANGGEIREFRRGEMLPEFEEVVCALQPGQQSDIFRTPQGYHIALLHARTQEPVPLEECRQDIKDVFMAQRRHAPFLRAIEDLRSPADIRFVPDPPPHTQVAPTGRVSSSAGATAE